MTIHELLAKNAKTQLWLAKEMNVTRQTIGRWNRSENVPLEAILKIARKLNVDPAAIDQYKYYMDYVND